MKTGLTQFTLVVIALAVPAFAGQPSTKAPERAPVQGTQVLRQASGPDAAEAAAGEPVYLRYCAACHGRSLKGDGPVADGLLKKPLDLTALARKNGSTFPYDRVAAMIDGRQSTRMHGTPDMPVWGEIFTLTAGTDSSSPQAAVARITHYVWSKQTSPKVHASKK
jgi:mono/diheme cytochrome c family protein